MNEEMEVIFTDKCLGIHDLLPATSGSAGIDLRACIDQPMILQEGFVYNINTGVRIHIKDENLCGIIIPRSGISTSGLVLANTVGLIDSDYQGNMVLKVMVHERDQASFINRITIQPYDRIAQLVLVPVVRPKFKVVSEFSSDSSRGHGGFGSTGK